MSKRGGKAARILNCFEVGRREDFFMEMEEEDGGEIKQSLRFHHTPRNTKKTE